MFGYKAFYRGKTTEVYALRSFDAQALAAKFFKAKKAYEVAVVLCAKVDGIPIEIATSSV